MRQRIGLGCQPAQRIVAVARLSDLYRKQRVAVAEVARTLAEMEQESQARVNGNGHT